MTRHPRRPSGCAPAQPWAEQHEPGRLAVSNPQAGAVALDKVRAEFGGWLCWPGLAGTCHAVQLGPWFRDGTLNVITASSPAEMRARLRAAEAARLAPVVAVPGCGRVDTGCGHRLPVPWLRCGPGRASGRPSC